MNPRRALAAVAGVAIAASMLFAAPAHAVDTTVTFTLTQGGLAIATTGGTPAGTVALGSVTPAEGTSDFSTALLSTTVTDTRNSLTGYNVTGSSTTFTAPAVEGVIAKADVFISIDAVDAITVGGAALLDGDLRNAFFVPTAGTDGNGGVIGAKAAGAAVTNALTALGVISANNTVNYTPTLKITVQPDTPDGDYSGVITQTVA